MSNQYRLVEVGNAELVAGLAKLVQQSNSLTAQLLAHLVELDERRLHLELGFSSLFAYCVERLDMSEGSAGRRVTAARVCRRFPEVFERIARGQLHLCALCALAPHLNEQNSTELFDASKGKTRRQIEALVAARFPRPDVREQIRRLPASTQGLTRLMAPEVASGAVEQALPLSCAIDHCEPQDDTAPVAATRSNISEITPNSGLAQAKIGIPHVPRSSRPRSREIEPLSADRFGVHFTADAELRELIERARALASHRVPNGDLAGLLKLMAASFVKQEEKRRFGIGASPRRANGEAASSGCETKSSGREATSSSIETKPSSCEVTSSSEATSSGGVTKPSRCEVTSSSETTSSGVSDVAAPPGGASVPSGTNEAKSAVAHAAPSGPAPHSRYLAVQVRREIHARDGGRCTYVSANGRRCDARTFIQFDHVEPFARDGSSNAPNLRLLCKAHNLLHARKCFGSRYIAAKLATRNRGGAGTAPR
jgi:hypothetical protein